MYCTYAYLLSLVCSMITLSRNRAMAWCQQFLHIKFAPAGPQDPPITWWRHQMEIFSALLALYEGNPPLTGGLPSQRPVTRSFYTFFDLHLNKRLNKQSRLQWTETPLRSLWRHCNIESCLLRAIGPYVCSIGKQYQISLHYFHADSKMWR